MIDAPLLAVAITFGIASLILAVVVNRLPAYYQIWSLIGQQVVMWGGLAVCWLRWNQAALAQHTIIEFGIIMLFAWPGMVVLDYLQSRKRTDRLQRLLDIPDDELANEDFYTFIWIGLIVLYTGFQQYTDRIGLVRAWCARNSRHITDWIRNFN